MIAFTLAARKMLRQELQAARVAKFADHYEVRTVTESSPSQPSSSASDGSRSGGTDDRVASSGGDTGPDVSPEFRSEMAALLAFYAVRISAARRSLNRTTADVIILAILNEQAVALRALTERWHAAAQKARDEKPERPAQNMQRKDEEPKSP